ERDKKIADLAFLHLEPHLFLVDEAAALEVRNAVPVDHDPLERKIAGHYGAATATDPSNSRKKEERGQNVGGSHGRSTDYTRKGSGAQRKQKTAVSSAWHDVRYRVRFPCYCLTQAMEIKQQL